MVEITLVQYATKVISGNPLIILDQLRREMWKRYVMYSSAQIDEAIYQAYSDLGVEPKSA